MGRHGTVRRHVPVEQYTQSTPGKYAEYASGTNKPIVTQKMKDDSDELARSRRLHVRNALQHAWEGYRTEAWGVSGYFANKKKMKAVVLIFIFSLQTSFICPFYSPFLSTAR